MSRLLLFAGCLSLGLFAPQSAGASWGTPVFEDESNYSGAPHPGKWLINRSASGACWQTEGRTFLPNPGPPCYHAGPYPWVDGNVCHIDHYQYNPYHLSKPKETFLGGEIRSKGRDGTLTPDRDYRVEARVRNSLYPSGLVTSFFLYGDADEVDYEFVSRQTNDSQRWPPDGGDPVMTNPWNEGRQKPAWRQVPGLSLTDATWDTFVIYWFPRQHSVQWWWLDPVHGETWLRTETDFWFVPDQPMNVCFNFWASNEGWPDAYSADLQPDQEDNGVFYTYEIDYVRVSASWFGDINRDGRVDGADLLIQAGAFGSTPWDQNWNLACDLNGDSAVDVSDLLILAGDWGK